MPRYETPEDRKPMTEEEWAVNKDCDLKNRDHKWQWKLDVSSGIPSMDRAICVHCGKETTLNREDKP